MTFDLSDPLKWADIISAFASISTFFAVIVAMIANHNSNKQLKVSLKIQEQSKNVSLLEQRVKIADEIRNDRIPSGTAVKVLFNEEIHSYFEEFVRTFNLISTFEHDKNIFFIAAKACDDNILTDNEVQDRILNYETLLQNATSDRIESIKADFKNYCDNHIFDWSENGLCSGRLSYNYWIIRNNLISAKEDYHNAKGSLLTLIELAISNSIEPVNE